jgi:hypothetical protein
MPYACVELNTPSTLASHTTSSKSTMEIQELGIEAYVVKNTFITFEESCACTFTNRRSQSVPPSVRLCSQDDCTSCYADHTLSHVFSEVSTDACTDASDEELDRSTMACRTESIGSFCSLSADMSSMDSLSTWAAYYTQDEMQPAIAMFPPQPLNTQMLCVPPPPTPLGPPRARLNTKAVSFTPKAAESEDTSSQYQPHFASMFQSVSDFLLSSDIIENVEICDDLQDCTIVIRAHGGGDYLVERVLTLAKEALLDATGHSKCLYVMGYTAPKPFKMGALGFECTLGVMQNIVKACWHVFKKGYCRHEHDCIKQHPVCTVPMRVLVATAELSAPLNIVTDFMAQVADLVITVTSSLRESPHTGEVAAWKSKESKCWTIEVSAKQDSALFRDFLLTVARTALCKATDNSKCLYMMGYTQKPFISKPDGFVVVIGDMQTESRACWDFFTSGICQRDCACRWEHPSCLMPITVLFKAAQ